MRYEPKNCPFFFTQFRGTCPEVSLKNSHFSGLNTLDAKNTLSLVSLKVIVTKFIIYIQIYNMSVCLLFNNKIGKFKVVIQLKCVPFVDAAHRIRGKFLLQLTQLIPQTEKIFPPLYLCVFCPQ